MSLEGFRGFEYKYYAEAIRVATLHNPSEIDVADFRLVPSRPPLDFQTPPPSSAAQVVDENWLENCLREWKFQPFVESSQVLTQTDDEREFEIIRRKKTRLLRKSEGLAVRKVHEVSSESELSEQSQNDGDAIPKVLSVFMMSGISKFVMRFSC
jgi:hypothetical protein